MGIRTIIEKYFCLFDPHTLLPLKNKRKTCHAIIVEMAGTPIINAVYP